MRHSSRKEEQISKLEKARVLISEAKEDLRHGSYNKAVSAAYFSVRLTAEHLLTIRTSKDDKIANAVYRNLKEVLREEKARQVRLDFLDLFNLRKYADHRGVLFTEDEARDIVKMAEDLMKLIINNLSRSDR